MEQAQQQAQQQGKTSRFQASIRWIGLVAAPLLALVCFVLLPEQYRGVGDQWLPFSIAGRATLAVMVWMAVWWLTEAIDISATALLPLALFPLLGIADMQASAAPYADRLIFLFMGSFLLALSMQRWGLGKRAALLTLRMVGTSPVNIVGGFMLTGLPPLALVLLVAAAVIFLTELTSNTATTAALVPVLAALAPGLGIHPYLFIFPAAFAASCAFMLPVATPPNAIVFGSGMVSIPQMAKAGVWLNLVGIVLITLLTYFVICPFLGVNWPSH